MKLESQTIYFRFAEVSDAAFILSLRTDKRYGQHISVVENDVKRQEQWLLDYKKKEALKQEYYFIIHRKSDDLPIGTVRIYDFICEEESFCWGSWILNENKTRYAALECALLIYDFAFFELGFKRCHMDMRKENSKVITFHTKIGVRFVGETEKDLLGHYFIEDYLKVRDDIRKLIQIGG